MVKRGMKPNIITYSSLINGYCKNKKVNEALDVFRDIQNKGLIHDVFTYNSMMQGLFETKNPVAATQLFNEMLAKGLNPDIFTYGTLLNGMCNNSQVSDALVLFRKLEKDEMMKDADVRYTKLGVALLFLWTRSQNGPEKHSNKAISD
ncbi:putative tetratricopeptide-like helical domain-containing protein [Tanacetum coccineum]